MVLAIIFGVVIPNNGNKAVGNIKVLLVDTAWIVWAGVIASLLLSYLFTKQVKVQHESIAPAGTGERTSAQISHPTRRAGETVYQSRNTNAVRGHEREFGHLCGLPLRVPRSQYRQLPGHGRRWAGGGRVTNEYYLFVCFVK